MQKIIKQPIIQIQGDSPLKLFKTIQELSITQQGCTTNNHVIITVGNSTLTNVVNFNQPAMQNKKNQNDKKKVKNQTLTKTFITCYFPNLEFLSIDNFYINNVEFVTFINSPKLIKLSLMNSKITNFKPFQKIAHNKLLSINIQNNYSPVINLQRIALNVHMNSIVLQFQPYARMLLQDLSSLAKFSSKLLDVLYVEGVQRIGQPKIVQRLYRKYQVEHQMEYYRLTKILQKQYL